VTGADRPPGLEDLLRELAPRVLAVLVRRYGQFDRCEDAVQEALLAASRQWPEEGRPTSPEAWLVTVARRRLTDQLRSEHARQRREDTAAHLAAPDAHLAPSADAADDAAALAAAGHDDTLTLLFLC